MKSEGRSVRRPAVVLRGCRRRGAGRAGTDRADSARVTPCGPVGADDTAPGGCYFRPILAQAALYLPAQMSSIV